MSKPEFEPINCGGLLAGSIEQPSEADFFAFTGTANAQIALTLVQTSGFGSNAGQRAQATVYSSTGAQVDQFLANQSRAITLPTDGTYLVRINSENLGHTGSYNLGLECEVQLLSIVPRPRIEL